MARASSAPLTWYIPALHILRRIVGMAKPKRARGLGFANCIVLMSYVQSVCADFCFLVLLYSHPRLKSRTKIGTISLPTNLLYALAPDLMSEVSLIFAMTMTVLTFQPVRGPDYDSPDLCKKKCDGNDGVAVATCQ